MNVPIKLEMIVANFDMKAYKRWLREEYANYRLEDNIDYNDLFEDVTNDLTDYLSDAAAQLLDEDSDLENEFYHYISDFARDYNHKLESKVQEFLDNMIDEED